VTLLGRVVKSIYILKYTPNSFELIPSCAKVAEIGKIDTPTGENVNASNFPSSIFFK